jgi:hypothetical protein
MPNLCRRLTFAGFARQFVVVAACRAIDNSIAQQAREC